MALQTTTSYGLLVADLDRRVEAPDKPYVYVAAGEKMPNVAKRLGEFILFYDDKALPGGSHQCIFADGHGKAMPADKVKKHLKARGKWRGE